MPLTKEQKEEIVSQLTEKMKGAKSVVFADFQGLSVDDLAQLRKEMREQGVFYNIAKKTLLRIAARESGYTELPDEILEGPVGAAFSMEDEIAAAKLVYKFSRKNQNLKLRGAIFEGRVLSVAETKELATLPGKEELIGKFIYLIKYPVQGFHGVLYNTVAGFVRALNAIKDQKEQTA